MNADSIGGNRDTLAELRTFAKAHSDVAHKITIIQVIQAAKELEDNPQLQKLIRQEGKQVTLMQAISLLVTRMGMEKAK
jgi:hypothetical protein